MSLFVSLLASAVLSTALAPVRLSPFTRAETRVPVPLPDHRDNSSTFWREIAERKRRRKRR